MKYFLPPILVAIGCCLLAFAVGAQEKPADSNLDAVLKKMDATAASFRTTQAEFEWDRYEKVIDEVDDIQSGTIYYRRTGKEVQMKAEITKPDRKYVLVSDGKIKMYLPKPDQLTIYDLRHRALSCTRLRRQRAGYGESFRGNEPGAGDDQRRRHGQTGTRAEVRKGPQ
jgi:hypothetical protein